MNPRQCELLPLAEGDFDPAGPGRAELRVQVRGEPGDNIVALARRMAAVTGFIVHAGTSPTPTVPRAEFEAEKSWKAPQRGRATRPRAYG